MTSRDETLAVFIRNARRMRMLTQHGAAKAAHVSRRQWAHLEEGGNVSVEFLKKAATALGLGEIPVSGSLTLTHGTGVDGLKLLMVADAIAEQVEALRDIAMNSLLPSERQLVDAPAVAAFAAEHEAMSDDETRRVAEASRRVSSDVNTERRAEPAAAPGWRRAPRAKTGRRS
jgi:transcriptional regulator with XRE-family HTH domain